MAYDSIDLNILSILEANGRASHAEIGRQVGITGPAVYARLKRLEDEGVIRGYRADIDRSKLGASLTAFVRVTTRPIKVETDTFEPFVWSEKRILECHDVASDDTFILKVGCESPADLRDLLMRIRERPQVMRTTSSVVLAIIKEPGLPCPESMA
jgi:Lrp/AsnC family leucine-responsive transcriptional regulator